MGIGLITISTWNMCYWQHRNNFSKSWNYLFSKINPDIALVQEAVPPTKLRALSNFIWDEIGKNRKWGSGIFSRFPIEKVEFDNSYPGAVVVGEVSLPNKSKITAISIHVLLEHRYSIIPLHRIFSDLTRLLEGRRGKRVIIIGGDFNASIQFDRQQKGESHRILFERVENFGLLNCIKKFHAQPVQTYRHKTSNEQWQLDYLFLSEKLESKLKNCLVIEDSKILNLSDHNPVIAQLSIE